MSTNPNTERLRTTPGDETVEGCLGASSASQGDVTIIALATPLDLPAERLAALRKIAEAATPGPWETLGGQGPHGSHAVCYRSNGTLVELPFRDAHFTSENAHHIAAFDPPTMLALLDRVTAAESSLARYIVDRTRFGDAMAANAVPAVVDAIMRELTADSAARAEAAEAAVARVEAICQDTDGNWLDPEDECNNVGGILQAVRGDGA